MYLEPKFVPRVPEGTQVLFLRTLTSHVPKAQASPDITHTHTDTPTPQAVKYHCSEISAAFCQVFLPLLPCYTGPSYENYPVLHSTSHIQRSCRNVLQFLVIWLLFFFWKFFFFSFPLLESIGIFIWKSGGKLVKCPLHSYLKRETVSLASSPCW